MIYFIYGQDAFRAHASLAALKSQWLDQPSTEIVRIPNTATAKELSQLMCSTSLFAASQLVIVENVFKSPLAESLLLILKTGLPNGVTLVIYETEPPDRRLALFKYLAQSAQVQNFEPLIGQPLYDYVSQLANQRDLDLSSQLIRRLISLVGNDLWRLDREVAKLAAYAKTQPLTDTAFGQLVASDIKQDIFGILNSISRRQMAEANQKIIDLIHQGEDPIGILAVMSWQLRSLIRIEALVRQGKSANDITRITGLHPYAVANSISQITHFSHRWLASAYQLIIKIDWRIKQGDIAAADAVDWLVATLAQTA